MVSRRGSSRDTPDTRGRGWGGRYVLLFFGLSAAFFFGFIRGHTTPTTVLVSATEAPLERVLLPPPHEAVGFLVFLLVPVLLVGYSMLSAAAVVAVVHYVRKWSGW